MIIIVDTVFQLFLTATDANLAHQDIVATVNMDIIRIVNKPISV